MDGTTVYRMSNLLAENMTELQKKMVRLVNHYRDEKKYLTAASAQFFMLAIGLGKNPFNMPELMCFIVKGMKKEKDGPLLYSNSLTDRAMFDELWKKMEESTCR